MTAGKKDVLRMSRMLVPCVWSLTKSICKIIDFDTFQSRISINTKTTPFGVVLLSEEGVHYGQ